MIITSDCQKYHAPRLKIFRRLVLVLEHVGWSVGVLEDWRIGGLGLALNKSAMLTGYAPTERRNAETPKR